MTLGYRKTVLDYFLPFSLYSVMVQHQPHQQYHTADHSSMQQFKLVLLEPVILHIHNSHTVCPKHFGVMGEHEHGVLCA